MKDDRYYRFSHYLREKFHCRVQRISVDAGFSCPNRDGALSHDGCIYCDNRGFSYNTRLPSRPLTVQIEEGIQAARKHFKAKKFMVYFQAFTNTYAALDVLKERYDTIKKFDDVVALAIGTRPDCVNKEILSLINTYTKKYDVWIEYGLQSANDETLQLINRGHTCNDFIKAVRMTRRYRKIKICAHVIMGLPHEMVTDMVATARLLHRLNIEGVKIHPLHVVKGTKLEALYRAGSYEPLTLDAYIRLAANFLENLSPETVIHRLSADCPADLLVAPHWICDKQNVIQMLEKYLVEIHAYQGRVYFR